jgi:hypothetical protein
MMARRGSSVAARGAAQNDGSGVVLTLVPSTTLYAPTVPQPGENMLFLRWKKTDPPKSMPLEDTWANTGPPDVPGYFIFLDVLPTDPPKLEEALRKPGVLPAPDVTGFVWAVSKPQTAVRTLLRLKLDAARAPCVDGDTPLNGPKGFPDVGFGNGWRVIADRTTGYITGFVVTYPPVNPAQPPAGITLPMTGNGVGWVRFLGLINADGAGASSALKTLVSASLDPLPPYRNRIVYAGAEYMLTIEGDGGRLSPSREPS